MLSDSPLRKRAGLKVWELDGEAVIYDADAGMGHVLNPTALQIWSLCDGRNTRHEIASALSTQHPSESLTIDHDVGAAVSQLNEIGLVEAL